jgi:hypothetical protein
MKILRTVTADDPFGEPWPPSSTDIWHVIRRMNGFTVWRAIRATQSVPPSTDAQSPSDGNCN